MFPPRRRGGRPPRSIPMSGVSIQGVQPPDPVLRGRSHAQHGNAGPPVTGGGLHRRAEPERRGRAGRAQLAVDGRDHRGHAPASSGMRVRSICRSRVGAARWRRSRRRGSRSRQADRLVLDAELTAVALQPARQLAEHDVDRVGSECRLSKPSWIHAARLSSSPAGKLQIGASLLGAANQRVNACELERVTSPSRRAAHRTTIAAGALRARESRSAKFPTRGHPGTQCFHESATSSIQGLCARATRRNFAARAPRRAVESAWPM
jgi:hypothetical protein